MSFHNGSVTDEYCSQQRFQLETNRRPVPAVARYTGGCSNTPHRDQHSLGLSFRLGMGQGGMGLGQGGLVLDLGLGQGFGLDRGEGGMGLDQGGMGLGQGGLVRESRTIRILHNYDYHPFHHYMPNSISTSKICKRYRGFSIANQKEDRRSLSRTMAARIGDLGELLLKGLAVYEKDIHRIPKASYPSSHRPVPVAACDAGTYSNTTPSLVLGLELDFGLGRYGQVLYLVEIIEAGVFNQQQVALASLY